MVTPLKERVVKSLQSGILCLAAIVATGVSEPVQASDDTVDEIVVIGAPIGVVVGTLELLDMQDGLADQIADMIGDMDDLIAEANEADCRARIETWRQACHIQMDVAHTGCLIAGGYLLGPLYTIIFDDLIADAVRPFGNVLTGLTCADWHGLALTYCDLIAASDRAPQIALCPVGGGS